MRTMFATSLRNGWMTLKCPKCGSDDIEILCWDGAKCGGHRITCANCKHIIERQEYPASEEVTEK